MRKIHTPEQDKIITHFQNTYTDMILLSPNEMAILSNPEKFPQINQPRLYKTLEKKAAQSFDELNFLLNHLPPYYQFKILSNEKFIEFFETIMPVNNVGLSKLEPKTRDLIIQVVARLFFNSITVLITTMPPELKRTLKNSVRPFVDLLFVMAKYKEGKSLENIPTIKIPELFRSKEPEER